MAKKIIFFGIVSIVFGVIFPIFAKAQPLCPNPGSACGGCIVDLPFVDDCPSTAVCNDTCYYGEIGDCIGARCLYCFKDPNKPATGECCDVECTGTGWKQTPNNAKCPAGKTCNANCQCVIPSTCGNGQLDAGEDCDIGPDKIPGTADDIDKYCKGQCQANCKCPGPVAGCKTGPTYTCPAWITCPVCSEELQGGLVPCGRNCDDPCTPECECAPCTLCHLFVLLKRIIDFLAEDVLFP